MPFWIRPWIFSNWALLTTGPIWLPSACGSPTAVASAAALAMATASACRFRGTSMRVGALHDWPLFMKQLRTPPLTERSRSASSRMMLADLPPSSWATRLTVSAAFLATWTPARVEPVNDTMSMPGCDEMAAPTVGPSPFTRLKTPAGTPASCSTSATRIAESGAISLGFSTMVQPAASAGATLHMIWFTGQFHGVMKPQTPTGSRMMRVEPLFSTKA